MTAKAQSSIEFIIVVMAVFFFFISLVLIFQQNIGEKTREKRVFAVQELALQVQNEINLASTTTSGYERQFEIPTTILGADYTISVIEGVVFIKTLDEKHAIVLPIPEINGEIQIGSNTIRKINDSVYLNTLP